MENTFIPAGSAYLDEAFFEERVQSAKEILNDTSKFDAFMQRIEKELKSIPGAGGVLSEVPVLASLIRAYHLKEYTEPPLGSIIAIIAGLLYLISITDLIPDTTPVVGFADDAAVIAFVLDKVKGDVDAYKQWQKDNNLRQ